MKKLGSNQRGVLTAIAEHKGTGGWTWGSRTHRMGVLDSLTRLGLIEQYIRCATARDGHVIEWPDYRPTAAGFALIEETPYGYKFK